MAGSLGMHWELPERSVQELDEMVPYLPTQQEIAEGTARIREGWTPQELAVRCVHKVPPVELLQTPGYDPHHVTRKTIR